jgi:hypothetical protein
MNSFDLFILGFFLLGLAMHIGIAGLIVHCVKIIAKGKENK